MEIPTGSIGDILGKKRTIQAAMLCSFIGILGMALGSSFLIIFPFYMLAQLGWSLYSGTGEALAYDSLKDVHQEQNYEHVISSSKSLETITTLVTYLIGGILYLLNFRLPFIAWSIAYLIAFIFSFYLKEPKVNSIKFTFRNYFKQMAEGVKELFNANMKRFFIIFFILLGVFFFYDWGMIKPAIAIHFGLDATAQSIVYALIGVVIVISVKFLPKIRKHVSDNTGLISLGIILGIAFVLASLNLGLWGILIILLIDLAGNLAYPWISIIVNKNTPSEKRATTLSTVAFISKLPHVLLVLIVGKVAQENILDKFNLGFGIIVILSALIGSLFVTIKGNHLSALKRCIK